MKTKNTGIIILLTVSLFLISCSSSTSGDSKRDPIKVYRRPASDFTVTTIDGKTISLSDYKGKKAILIDIWATWCGPCRMEMPLLQKLYEKHSDKIEIIGASVDDPKARAQVEKFVTENKITFKIVHDENQEIAKKYPSNAIPYLTVIDKEGYIIKTFRGFSPNIISEIEKLLELK